MGILNFIAAVIIMLLIGDDNDTARELHDEWFSSNEIGDLLDMSEEEVDEIVWENDHNDNDFYGY